MNTLIFFGIGSNSFGKLNTVSFAVNDPKEKGWLLVDCGPTIPREIRKARINFLDIRNIFISHGHFDHWLGLPYLLFGRHLEVLGEKKNNPNFLAPVINIVIERKLSNIIIELFKNCHSDIKELSYKVNYIDILPCSLDKIALDNFELKVFQMIHGVETFGCKINDKSNKSISYSSDTLPCPKFIKAVEGTDYLIHEGMVPDSEIGFAKKTQHSTFQQAAEIAKNVKPKLTFLTHIRPNYFPHKDKIERELKRQFKIKIIFPDEGKFIKI